MENDIPLLLQLGGLIVAIVAAYFTARYTAQKALDDSGRNSEDIKEVEKRIHACFKAVDECKDRLTILERDTAHHLDKPTADDRYVQHKEMREIKEQLSEMSKSVSKELHHITELLTTTLVNHLSGKDRN